MIIDIHNHIVAGGELGAYQAGLIASAGFHGKGKSGVTEDSIKRARWRGHSHGEVLQEVGTDWAFISPRPYTMMHSMKPRSLTQRSSSSKVFFGLTPAHCGSPPTPRKRPGSSLT